jgi:glycosyltransferase involved in cell wall biosynthesis
VRIGLLTTSFPRRPDDIAGNFVLGFARALARQGHSVEVLAPEPAEPIERPRFAELELSWVRYLRPRALQRTFYGAGVLDNLARDPLAFLGLAPFPLALWAEARQQVARWDALVSHWALPCALVAGQLRESPHALGRASQGPRPHLAVLHSADVALLERLPGRRHLARRVAMGANALVFTSRDLRQRFLALLSPLERGEWSDRMHVCAMGIEPPASQGGSSHRVPARARLGLERFTLLSLGRLVPIKGLEHAIEAVAALPGVELVIAGDGPARRSLVRRATRLGAPVRFVGEVHGDTKRDWLRAADALLMPSLRLASGRTEGMPTTLLEAMQVGLPVIASKVGGIPDLIEDQRNGLLVEPGSPAALRQAIEGLLASRARRAALAEEGRETARWYEWDTLGPRFAELLTPE